MDSEIKKIIAKYIDQTITVDELEKLDEWCKANAENETAFYQHKATLLMAEVTNKNVGIYKKRTWGRLQQKISEEKQRTSVMQLFQRHRLQLWFRAASVVLILSLGIAIGAAFISSNVFNTRQPALVVDSIPKLDTLAIQSHASSKAEVYLPDGSKVWLNSNSEIKFLSDFKKKREVHLTGEAYFDVEKTTDGKHFFVHTSDIKVEVLGTMFNIKSYPEEGLIETTLEEGEVALYRKGARKDIKMTSLKPNQHATFIRKEGELHLDQIKDKLKGSDFEKMERQEELVLAEDVKTDKYTAWKDGHLIIDGEPFESFVKKMERWYNVEIVINNERVKKLHFTANFKNETIEQALQALKMAHPFDYTFDVENNIIRIE